MNSFNMLKKLALGVALSCVCAWQANAIIAYNNATGDYGNQPYGSGNFVLGNQFTVGNTALTVTALGAFDNNQDGWSAPVTVAIYDVTTKTMLGNSVTFSGTTGPNLGTLIGGSRFQNVSSFTLAANQVYMIVAAGYGSIGSGQEVNWNAGGLSSNPYTTVSSYITAGNNYYSPGTTLVYPLQQDGGPSPRYNAGTFEFAPVPEARSFAMASAALLGFFFILRLLTPRQKIA